MAIKFRVIQHYNNMYNFLEIHILEESVNKPFVGAFNNIGAVTFQQNKGEKNWYGLRFVIDTNRFRELNSFTKIAKKINETTDYYSQPADVIKAINGIEMYLFNNRFFKVTDKGKYCFKVLSNGFYHSDLVAKNEVEANKMLNVYISKYIRKESKMTFELKELFLIE